jgi:hypothetical protein
VTSTTALAIQVRAVAESQVVLFDAVNTSSRAISIAPAFGYDFYFHLEIETAEGVAVRLPVWELTREISGRCLRSGETLSFRVPLNRWDASAGTDAGCTEEPCSKVQLPAGSYRVRARYRPVKASTARSRCASISDLTTSEWLPFVVPGIGDVRDSGAGLIRLTARPDRDPPRSPN